MYKGSVFILCRFFNKKGILCYFHNTSRRLTGNVVLPEPRVPTTSVCFVKYFREKPIVSQLDDEQSFPTFISSELIMFEVYVLLFFQTR